MPDYETPTVEKLKQLLHKGVISDQRSQPTAFAIALAADRLCETLRDIFGQRSAPPEPELEVERPEDLVVWTKAVHVRLDMMEDAIRVVWQDDDDVQYTESVPSNVFGPSDYQRVEGTTKQWSRAEWERLTKKVEK